MSFFDWDESYNLGVDSMNVEHMRLMKLMNTLFLQNKVAPNLESIWKDFEALEAYIQKHFKDEEEYMESIDYPGLKAHREVHRALWESFSEFKQAEFRGEKRLSEGFFKFLKLWLIEHIKGTDMKYGDYARDVKHSVKGELSQQLTKANQNKK